MASPQKMVLCKRVSHKTIPHQFGIMINKRVIYLKGKNLQITVLDNSLLQEQEKHLIVRSGIRSKQESERAAAAYF